MLEDLHKEKQQFENWLNYIGEVSVSVYLNISNYFINFFVAMI